MAEYAVAPFRWPRASSYEVVGETHIAPASGSTIDEYIPLEEYQAHWKGKKRKGRFGPAYNELLEVDLEDPDSIVAWCNKWGLLGILPHRTLHAAFWPRWVEPVLPSTGLLMGLGSVGGVKSPTPEIAQLRYQQGVGTQNEIWWMSLSHEVEIGAPLPPEELTRAIGPHHDFESRIELPGAWLIGHSDGTLGRSHLVYSYARFFPRREGVVDLEARNHHGEPDYSGPRSSLTPKEASLIVADLERQMYPTPPSGQFWAEYGEPLQLFRRYADEIRWSVRRWEQTQDRQGTKDPFSPSFQSALRGVHPSAYLEDAEDGSWRWSWSADSLYALLNLMVLRDFALRGAMLKHCSNSRCGRSIITDDARQEHCSGRCANAKNVRRHRAKQ